MPIITFDSEKRLLDDFLSLQTPMNPRLLSEESPFLEYGGFKNFLLKEGDIPEGRISAFINNNLNFENQPVGYLGFFDLIDGTTEKSRKLILSALSYLKNQGIKYVFGPINFSNWHSHSFVTWSSHEPVFPTEIVNKPEYPEYFLDCGFLPVKRFYSSLDEEITKQITLNSAKYREYTQKGYTTRRLDKSDLEKELSTIYTLSLASMNQNWGFCPISFDDFRDIHKHHIGATDPDFIHFVCDPSGNEVGFITAIPGKDKFILHAMGTAEGHKDTLPMLIYSLFMKMIMKGYSSAIYSYLDNSREVKNTLKKTSRAFREYTLFGRAL